MPKRQYSDQEKADALVLLDSNRGVLAKTSSENGIPSTTMARWRNGAVNPDVTHLRHGKKQEITSKISEVVLACLGEVTKKKLRGTSAKDLMVSVGIGVDKIMLLTDEEPDSAPAQVNVFIQNHLGSGELPEF